PTDITDLTVEEPASETSSYHIIREEPQYLQGPGWLDSALKTHWNINGDDISVSLMRYRDFCVSNNHSLLSTAAALSINFIFLFENEDQMGGLIDEMRDASWSAIWRHLGPPVMEALPEPSILETHAWARRASSMPYRQFVQELNVNPPESVLLRRVFQNYANCTELWRSSCTNEATYVKNLISPCLDALFPGIPHAMVAWDNKLDDSRNNRRLEPDYLVSTNVRGVKYTVLNIEAKTPRNYGRSQIWDDVAKLGNEMKLCLDTVLTLGPSQPVAVQGIVIKESEGVYVMRLYASCSICSHSSGLFPLGRMLEILQAVKVYKAISSSGGVNVMSYDVSTWTPPSATRLWTASKKYVRDDRVQFKGREYQLMWDLNGAPTAEGGGWKQAWDESKFYNTGAAALYQSYIYTAKWYAKGTKPDDAAGNPWTKGERCSAAKRR
ncbi:hypothetical protein BGZ70_000992, partial [Mortierella alpina]